MAYIWMGLAKSTDCFKDGNEPVFVSYLLVSVSILNRLQFSSPDIFFFDICLDIDGGRLRMSNYLFFFNLFFSLGFYFILLIHL
jgi:hypothetical protein